MQEEFELGLTLSGGGAKGAAHIGVLKAMEERGIKADIVSGTSSGAIVGSLYCNGLKADEILDFYLNTPIFRPSYYTWKKPGLLNTDGLAKILEPLFEIDSFESLQIPLHIVATDLIKARQKIFSSGILIKAILASSSFPGIFAPIEFLDTIYVDGGVLNNFPTEIIEHKCKKQIGVNVQHIESVDKANLTSSFSVLQRVFSISTRLSSISKYHNCDLIIAPEKLAKYNTFDMFKLKKMYEIGYEEASIKLDQYLADINSI